MASYTEGSAHTQSIKSTACTTADPTASTLSSSPPSAYGHAVQPPHPMSHLTSQFQEETVGEKPLFPHSLISPAVSAALPPGYIVRPLLRSDYHRGFLSVLAVLATVGSISLSEWNARYDSIAAQNSSSSSSSGSSWLGGSSGGGGGGYFILCIVDTSRPEEESIVGTGTVLVERKFIHELGLVGHIEDIAVAKDQQGKKLGLRIIQALDFVSESVGCYKTILDCSEANEGFYVKCNFRRTGLQMARYYDMTGKSKSSHV